MAVRCLSPFLNIVEALADFQSSVVLRWSINTLKILVSADVFEPSLRKCAVISYNLMPFSRAGTNVRGANVMALASALAAWTKTLTLAINFKPEERGLLYCICAFLVTRPFTWYHNFNLLTLKFNLLLTNLNLGHNFRTRSDRAFIIAHVYSL